MPKNQTRSLANGTAFFGSLITIGLFVYLPFSGEYIRFAVIGAIVFPIALLRFLAWIHELGRISEKKENEPLILHVFECRHCDGLGKTTSSNGTKKICDICCGFGELLHPLEEECLSKCNLCKSSGKLKTVSEKIILCTLCKGYGIKPELIGDVRKRIAAETSENQSLRTENQPGLLARVLSIFM